MLKSAASKVMWVGRATVFLVGLAVILALVFGAATTALAGTGVGAVFNLGKANTVDAVSKLAGATTSSMLMVDNNGAGTALDLRVGPSTTPAAEKGVAPMKVDSQAKVNNLNADELDGKNASDLEEPRGYAQVNHTGPALVPGSSKGVIDVVRTASDVYCFDLAFTPRAAVASAHLNNNATVGTLISPASGCTAPHNDVAAKVYGANDSSVHADVSFGIVFM